MDIQIKQKTRVLISCTVSLECDERQYKLLKKDPGKIFVLPTGAIFEVGPKIEEEEVIFREPDAFKSKLKMEEKK